MIHIETITAPKAKLGGNLVDVTMQTQELGTIECSLGKGDLQAHLYQGKNVTIDDLFSRALAGEFGPVTVES